MKKMNKKIEITLLVLSSFFVGCLVGILVLGLAIPKEIDTSSQFVQTIDEVEDAIVSIEEKNLSTTETNGTGFIYKKTLRKAYILTNEHVVEKDNVYVTNSKGETTPAKVLGRDKKIDVAVLEIDSKYAPKTVNLGNSDKAVVGEEIIVIGSPLEKELAGTVTKGIISGKNRNVPMSDENPDELLLDGIQFDAAVNPGNSGSPLFNHKGEVIGICTMKFIRTEIEGMGFAIPINQAINVMDSLEKGQEVDRPELGITMVEVSNTAELKKYNVKIDNTKYQNGIVILEVKEGSNADNKLEKEDIITQVDNIKISETDDIKKVLLMHKKGDTIVLTLIRNDKEKKIKITLK